MVCGDIDCVMNTAPDSLAQFRRNEAQLSLFWTDIRKEVNCVVVCRNDSGYNSE